MKKTIGLFVLIFFTSISSWSQLDLLTLQDAIRIGLEKNYAILIAENNQAANKYARNIGNAGMLPTISLNGGASYSNNSLRQDLSNGTTINSTGVVSTNYNLTAQLNWTLFDGLKMFATFDRLTALKNQSEYRTRFEMENLVSKVMQSYFDIVKNKQIYLSILESISIGEERLTIAEKKFNIGSGSKTELLQAKIDLNTLRTQLYSQQILINESKINLNQLLARDPAITFDVEDTIPLGNLLDLANIRKEYLTTNSQVQISSFDISINKMARREVNGLKMPRLVFNASYGFSRAQNQAGFTLLNQNLGFNTGISLTYNIFDSWRVNTQYKLASYNLQNATQNFELIKLQTDGQIVNAYSKYTAYLDQSNLQKDNVSMARENADLSLERFKQGLANFLELREAQRSYVDAVTAYVTAQYNAKIQEVELLRLKGELIK